MTLPSPRQSPAEVATRLRVVTARIIRQLRREVGGMPAALLSAMVSIESAGACRAGELASAEGVSAPTLTRILARLEAEDCVKRVADPQDGRSSILSLTPHGREFLAHLRAEHEAVLARALATLDQEELTRITRAVSDLETLAAALIGPARGDGTPSNGVPSPSVTVDTQVRQ